MTTLPSSRKIIERYHKINTTENILLVGTVGAGKSATINTITAALSGERTYRAPTGSLGESRRRTTTHLIWYNTCGIAKERIKSLKIPKSFPNLVDMTGLRTEDTDVRSMEKLLDMIIMGYIPDKTSIPALQDVQRTRGSGGIWRHFPFMYDKRRINKILFVASATEPVPRELIDIVKRVAQPDGSAKNLNPRYIPIFGLMTKSDLVDWNDPDVQQRQRDFLDCLGIDEIASFSRWENNPSGEYTTGVLYFLDKLLAPDVRYVFDQVSYPTILIGRVYERPILVVYFIALSILGVGLGALAFNQFDTAASAVASMKSKL